MFTGELTDLQIVIWISRFCFHSTFFRILTCLTFPNNSSLCHQYLLSPGSTTLRRRRKISWSRKYVKSAFPQSQEETLSRLFNRASELVQEQNLYAKAFVGQQHSKKLLEQKREQAANLLQSEFRNAIEIQGHPTFAGRLCYGVLIYQSGSGATIKLPAATTSSFTSPKSPALPSAPQPAAAPSLEDFEFNCFPPRLGINTQSCKLRAEQLFVGVSGASQQLGDFRVGPLRTRLEARNILSDPDHQCLMYQTSDGIFELTDDDDLRNAVRDARRSSRNYLRISCKTQDDIGWLTSLLLRCELLRGWTSLLTTAITALLLGFVLGLWWKSKNM